MKITNVDILRGEYLLFNYDEAAMTVIVLFPDGAEQISADDFDTIEGVITMAVQEGCSTPDEFYEVLKGVSVDGYDPEVGLECLGEHFKVIVSEY